MSERCRSICGDDPEHCFADSQRQIDCLSDMVVNKTFPIALLLEEIKRGGAPEKAEENLDMALRKLKELTNWVKYLNVVRDVKQYAFLSEEYSPERRREWRYPLYARHVKLMVTVGEASLEGDLLDFSTKGVRFTCPSRLAAGAVYRCSLHTVRSVQKSATFEAAVIHCSKKGGLFVVGAKVDRVIDERSFDFFDSVLNFIQAQRGRRAKTIRP